MITSFKYAFSVPTYTKFPTASGQTFINWNAEYSYKHIYPNDVSYLKLKKTSSQGKTCLVMNKRI